MSESETSFRSGFVTLLGRPNVGKSTLLNALVGQKVAITSDKPQTTRNRIQGVLSLPGVQVVFLDTPGMHKPRHLLGEYMVQITQSTLREVDLILYVVDSTARPGPGEAFILERLSEVATPVFLVVNKIDSAKPQEVLELITYFNDRRKFTETLAVSALSGNNLDLLKEQVIKYLPPGPRYYPDGMVTDQPEQFLIGELIREKVLMQTREEIPHAVAVQVESMEERPNGLMYVSAIIFVERSSQKAIIIGDKATRLKQIGMQARQEMEGLLGTRLFLDLRVKVKQDWRKRPIELQRLGFPYER